MTEALDPFLLPALLPPPPHRPSPRRIETGRGSPVCKDWWGGESNWFWMKKRSCFVFTSSLVGVERIGQETGQETLGRGFCVACAGTGEAVPNTPGLHESQVVSNPACSHYIAISTAEAILSYHSLLQPSPQPPSLSAYSSTVETIGVPRRTGLLPKHSTRSSQPWAKLVLGTPTVR